MGLYLALNYTRDHLVDLGMEDYCTTRKYTRGQKLMIASNGSEVKQTKSFESSNMPVRKVTAENGRIKRKMLKEALRVAIKCVMKNHVYTFRDLTIFGLMIHDVVKSLITEKPVPSVA